jgi:hypothetical protein
MAPPNELLANNLQPNLLNKSKSHSAILRNIHVDAPIVAMPFKQCNAPHNFAAVGLVICLLILLMQMTRTVSYY